MQEFSAKHVLQFKLYPIMLEIRQRVTFSLFEFTFFFQFGDYITFCIGKESVFLRGNPFFGPQRPFHERKKPLFSKDFC